MPKGIPKAGFRRRRGSRKNAVSLAAPLPAKSNETDAQIRERLTERFDILEALTASAIDGDTRALIVSGPAGLGKSFTVEQALLDWDPEGSSHTIVKGYVRPTGLYRTLYHNREPGQVVVFDDADSIFFDDVSLNMLKAVCDTTERRVLSYLSEAPLKDDEDEALPKSFAFEGTIVFITNLDFDQLVERGHKLAPHLLALISRSMYVDLAMKTARDYIVRIRQVLERGMLRDRGLSKSQESDVIAFIEKYASRLREISLRMAIKVGTIRKTDKPNWEKVAVVTCCRN